MFCKAMLVLMLVGAALSAPFDVYTSSDDYEDGDPYAFQYGVNSDYTGTNFGQTEQSDGNVVKGSYSVLLPDSRKQTVNYIVDDINGYQAEVVYYGEAIHPEKYGPPAIFRPSSNSYTPAASYQ
ncbi:cuticle protein 19-like [Panulirus ornatus]|uniref:cuticle protein 19-like n=1 Tax=Panulirus ornatus TaxID=150431 RepID=UPI003A8C4001